MRMTSAEGCRPDLGREIQANLQGMILHGVLSKRSTKACKDENPTVTRQLLDKAFAKISASCTQCHAKYRYMPH